ncbi:flagellar export chaperone FliS [Aciduricibacillus chroicocephali]|uniref:Flagellar secretion chaperone FliS n=1 Tax=Aciduricibacillus chroicocephali TaxID=3054939 RepID=A0ABY9KTW2_9BACI|nr:flagellar export chaperone FliS [Bacillaceae bacterium 44XB]
MNKPHQAYQNNAVNTATGAELTLMLYNGCIKFIKQAKRDMAANHIEGKNTHIQKAQNIIRELMITLDPKVEISKQFAPLYDFMLNRLTEANIQNNEEALDEVMDLAVEFRDTWKQVIQKTRQVTYAQGAEV